MKTKTFIARRTVKATIPPESNRSWLTITLPSGEEVKIDVLGTQGSANNRVAIAITAPRGFKLLYGEKHEADHPAATGGEA